MYDAELEELRRVKNLVIRLLDVSTEMLIVIFDYCMEKKLPLPPRLGELIEEATQLLEEISTTSATPHSQHPKNQQN